jgi:DNA polymerase
VAPPGKKLVISDLANIEGRIAAWEAGEEWKLQAFRDYDNETGPDLYKLAYAKSFNIPHEDVDKSMRQIGKCEELMLQYQGSVGAFVTGAVTYNIDLDAMAAAVQSVTDTSVWKESEGFLKWAKSRRLPAYGLKDNVYVACHVITSAWRRAHPAISSLWPDLEEAVKLAIANPDTTFNCRRFKVRRDGAWLFIGLPSGRRMCYPSSRVDDKGKISYMGVSQYTKKWERIYTYGGKILEQCTQSLGRDVLADSAQNVEKAGYEIVLSVHDEYITEAPNLPQFNEEHLSSILATNPPWCADIPLAAAGFTSYRYRKD